MVETWKERNFDKKNKRSLHFYAVEQRNRKWDEHNTHNRRNSHLEKEKAEMKWRSQKWRTIKETQRRRNQKQGKTKRDRGSWEIGERNAESVYKEREYLKKWGFAHV